jgi:hypothetical protein
MEVVANSELVQKRTMPRQGLDGSQVLETSGELQICIAQEIVRCGGGEFSRSRGIGTKLFTWG